MTTTAPTAGPGGGPGPNPDRGRSLPPLSDDRGATMILFAVVLIGLMAISGLVIDGGRLFAERRQQQNAADFASMAATRELDRYQRGLLEADGTPTDAEDVLGVALDSVAANGGDPTEVVCTLVDEEGAPIVASTPSCPTSGAGDATARLQAAVGVHVRSSRSASTIFMKVVGASQFTARADATATIQALRSLPIGAAPIMVCGTSPADLEAAVEAAGFGDFTAGSDDTYPIPILRNEGTRWGVNPDSVADRNDLSASPVYRIHDNQAVAKCGAGGNGFKGLVDQRGAYRIPGWWDSKTGTTAGPTRNVLGSYLITVDGQARPACAPGQLDQCIVVLPICSHSNLGNGTNAEFFCVMFGAFYVVQVDVNTHDGYFLGDAVVVLEGRGGGDPANDAEVRLIKLIS
jgi:Flp pilus assembly protein TadG